MEELIKILSGLRPDVDFEKANALIDNGILDSFDIISLVGELSDHYDVEIGVEHLLPENFNSPRAILDLIQRLQDEE